MGVRIFAYAVDLPRLDAFLELSLTELLGRYVNHGNDPNERLTFTYGVNDDTFVATPKKSVSGAITDNSGRRYSVFTEQQLQALPVLQRSARYHLSSGSIYQSQWLFQAFSNCSGVNFIHRLIDGQRRWWIGSVLQFASGMIAADDYDELTRLFQQILRGIDCGFPIPDADIGFITDGLPFTPENDPDLRIGRWSEKESLTAVQILSYIVSLSPTFVRPPGPIGIAPDDAEWNQWVHGNVASLLRVSDIDYDVCNVLTFIG